MPVKVLTRVDLPAPFSPISAITSPGCTDSATLFSAVMPAKRLLMPASCSTGGVRAAVPGDAGLERFACMSEDLRELVDVLGVVGERFGHRRLALRVDDDAAHAPGGDLAARPCVRGALDEIVGRIRDGVAQVDRVPDRELLDSAALDVAGHFKS